MSKKFINLKVVGGEPELESFLTACSMIQKLGLRGCSRKLSLVIDGDGSGQLKFYLNGDEEILPMTDEDVKDILPEIWIGE